MNEQVPIGTTVRNQALDALRGFAILAMVLSGSIAFGVLPAWMYHAQVPPPGHVYSPWIAGISWVDLVFPFFLFSLGAAIPLSLSGKLKGGGGAFTVGYTAVRRLALLVFFAFFTVYMRAGVLSAKPQTRDYLLSIGAFGLLCFQFYQPATGRYKNFFALVRILAYAAGLALLFFLPFRDGKGFSTDRVDIIILVLGNMVFFGSLIWWLTRDKPLWRIAILPLVMAVFLGAACGNGAGVASGATGAVSGAAGHLPANGLATESWTGWLYHWSPLPWVYRFYYLKYLFIIIPGTLAGDWLRQFQGMPADSGKNKGRPLIVIIATLSFALVISNVVFLFGRHLVLNLWVTLLLLMAIGYAYRRYDRIRKMGVTDELVTREPLAEESVVEKTVANESVIEEPGSAILGRFFRAGAFLLLLGLFFESYEGGIKKDPSTFSYYFVCSGLAFFMLIGLFGMQSGRIGGRVVNFLGLNGRNPMVAYTAGNLLLIPVLQLSGGMRFLDRLSTAPWPGLLRGLLFTGIVSLITVVFTKRKWFWKT